VFKPQQTRTHGSVHRGGGDISAHRRDTLTIVVPPAALIRALVTGSEGISRVPRTVSRGTKKPQGHKLTISDASPSLFQEPGQLVRFRSVPSG
jgi:hypothetical protein